MPSRHAISPLVFICLVGFAAPAAAQQNGPGAWDPRFTPPDQGGLGFYRNTEALVVDPTTGDLYAAGGTRLRLSDEPVVRWSGDDWASLGTSFDGDVRALAFTPDGTLYAGGDFTSIDGVPVSHIARFDGNTWSALGQGIDDDVFALAVDPLTGDLYAGGNFSNAVQADGTPIVSPDLVRWTGSAWEPVGYGSDGLSVDAIAFDPVSGDLFVGGRLSPGLRNTDSTLVAATAVARLDATAWTAVDDGSIGLRSVGALVFAPDGRLYAAHDRSGGFAAWDRTSWSVPAGGLGIVEANGRRTGDEAAALAIGEGVLYVGGRFDYVTQADGTAMFAPGVVAYDPDANRFEALGAGINRSTTAGHAAQALAVRPNAGGVEELFVGGIFTEAGARPAADIARWTSEAPFAATDVTFRVDMRAPVRMGLLGGLDSRHPTNFRPMVDVLNGTAANAYLLYDVDGDSIWTAPVAMPTSATLDYAYAFDVSGSGFERGTDWVYELAAPEVDARTVSLTGAAAHTLPVARFDEFALRPVDPDDVYRTSRHFASGDPGSERFPRIGGQGIVRIDPERLDR